MWYNTYCNLWKESKNMSTLEQNDKGIISKNPLGMEWINKLLRQFAIQYFHIFLFFTFVNFMQPISSNFFTSIGKPKRGSFLALTRQIIFLLPLIVIFPLFMGIDGVMYAGPVADCLAAVVSAVMIVKEFRRDIYKTNR